MFSINYSFYPIFKISILMSYEFSFIIIIIILRIKFSYKIGCRPHLRGGKGMKIIILEYSSIPLFGSFNGGNGKSIPLFGSLGPRLGEGNRMEWKIMKRIILEYSSLPFPCLGVLIERMESSFPCLRV